MIIPTPAVVLTAGADVQADRIEAEIVGWGEGEESWGIEYRIFKGNVEKWDLWDELDAFFLKKFQHASNAELHVAAACIDSGHKSKIVQAFVNRCHPRRVWAVKGVSNSGIPWVTRSRKLPILLLKVNAAKEAIYSRLNLEQPGPGYLHFPQSYDLEYFRQLTSERVVTRFRFGQPVRAFEKHGRNEALDARVYAMAALEMLRPNYAKLTEHLQKTVAESTNSTAQLESVAKPEPPRPRSVARPIGTGLVRSWKR